MARGRSTANDLVYVDPKSVRALQDVQAQLKKAGNSGELTKKLNAAIRDAASPLTDDLKQAAKNIEVVSSGSKAGKAYSVRNAKYGKKGNQTKASKRGMRETMAQGIKVKIAKGKYSGVRIVLESPDKDVNRIGANFNKHGFVRHPLYGNKNHWYATRAPGAKDWWWNVRQKHEPLVRDRVRRAINDFAKDLAKQIDRAA